MSLNTSDEKRLDKLFVFATAILVAAIVYGCLYPFQFRYPIGGAGPVWKLLNSWNAVPNRGHFLFNVLLYAPLGFCGALAMARRAGTLSIILFVTICGGLLSASVELSQYYVAGRVTEADDVYANSIGTVLGAVVGTLAHGNFRWSLLREIATNRVPLLLLTALLGYRLYPYVPVVNLHTYWNALKPVVLNPSLTRYDLFRYTAIWLAIAALIEAISGPKRAGLFFPLFIGAVFTAQMLIVDQALKVAEISGAISALAAWSLLVLGTGARFRVAAIALFFCVFIVVDRLQPFHFTANARHFGWIPFLSFLNGSPAASMLSFLERIFLYGSLIWLLGKTGFRLTIATITVAAALFAASWAEAYIPGRSAEITDAIMALLTGAFITVMEFPRQTYGSIKHKGASGTGTS